jgi:hypothetical protein
MQPMYYIGLDVHKQKIRGRHRDAFSESRMRSFRKSGSMSGCEAGSMVELERHRQPKGSETDRLHLNHRVTPRLHKVASCYPILLCPRP